MSLDVDAFERRLDGAASGGRDRSEGENVVSRVRKTAQRASDVIADARARMRQGRNVDDNPHATQTPRENATAATAPTAAKAGTSGRRYGARAMKIGKSASRNRG